MQKLVQFGAGNIGRSFIGQLFSRSGFEVVFIDIDHSVIDALNRERSYRVIIKRNDTADEILTINGVRAVDGSDLETVADEIASASYIATSVGKNALPHILPAIAKGVEKRFSRTETPIDIIIAENIRDASSFMRTKLSSLLPELRSFDEAIGLVETSIGKMVPIMTDEDRQIDPLWVFAEAYNSLIVDKKGFITGIPNVDELKPVDNIGAYVDRKLFVHNLGHASVAYLGFRQRPDLTFVYEVLSDEKMQHDIKQSMREAASALHMEYPKDLPEQDLSDHIEDLISRFQNRALKDTVYRVGRDLRRKLDKTDRVVGAMLLASRHGLPFDRIAESAISALFFRAADEHGKPFPGDKEFIENEMSKGIDHVLRNICRLSELRQPEADVYRELKNRWDKLTN